MRPFRARAIQGYGYEPSGAGVASRMRHFIAQPTRQWAKWADGLCERGGGIATTGRRLVWLVRRGAEHAERTAGPIFQLARAQSHRRGRELTGASARDLATRAASRWLHGSPPPRPAPVTAPVRFARAVGVSAAASLGYPAYVPPTARPALQAAPSFLSHLRPFPHACSGHSVARGLVATGSRGACALAGVGGRLGRRPCRSQGVA